MDIYGEWIRLVADFTTKSLQSWQVRSLVLSNLYEILTTTLVSTNASLSRKLCILLLNCYYFYIYLQWASSSVYYLLGLWSRLVTSVPYLKGGTPSLLDETVPKITEGFITSRFDSVQVYSFYSLLK